MGRGEKRERYQYNIAWCVLAVIVGFSLLAAWLNFYSMTQFIMLHRCKVSLWNVKGFCAYRDVKSTVLKKMAALKGLHIDIDNIDWGTPT